MKNLYRLICYSLLGCFLFSAGPLWAQQQQQLDDVQEIVAIVNDEVISLYDLKQRMLLFLISSGRQKLNEEETRYIQQQSLQSLIDDKLKIGEAEKYSAVISDEELEQNFAGYAQQFNLNAEQFEQQLNQAGIDKKSMLKQIEASLAWEQVVGGLLMPQVSVTDDEIYNTIERFEHNKGQDEFRIREIFLLVTDNTRREETKDAATRIYDQLKAGSAQFPIMARQFSASTTSAVGGDMGWVMKSELPKEFAKAIATAKKGDIIPPIEREDGYYVLQLEEKRQVLTPSPEDTEVTLSHLFFKISDGAQEDEISALEKAVGSMGKQIEGCADVSAKAAALDASSSGELGTLRVGELPESMHQTLLETEVGKATKPLREEDGFRLMVICDRKVPEINIPDYDAVQNNLTNQRVGLMARRHLRDLRRDAIIDYR
ncbi:peptidylprolyl isomerase [Emcibacter sp.]|uniref:peptidylprolyl isomerase n=1 Tax=Emcibacter sp. TaxID=1979954 RepID=UPI002AA8DF36|nr:peptidylprolyl isomerase [Emcibacter sp.]